jgi:NodT family efflux transporter outer membrane factor (OMF) lipoprotein
MLLVLPACGIPPLRLGEPGPPLPSTFKGSASPVNSAQLGIAKFFNDPILIGLIDQALAGNRELRVLNEEVEVARNEFLARRGAYLPFASFQGGVGLDKHSVFTPLGAAEKDLEYLPGKHFPDPVPDFLLRLNFLIPLDIWRELRNARDAAFQRYLAVKERRNYFVTRLVAEVAENYYGLMALDRRLETLNQTITLFQDSLKIAQARFRAGRGTTGVLPVRRFEAEVAKNQSELLIVRQEIIEVENRINFLANRFPQPVERLSARFFDVNMPLSVGLPAQLLQNRPDIRQAERELVAAGLDVKVARAHFFPRVDITGGVGYEAFSPKYLFWTPDALIYNVAGELTAPLINKVAIRAEYRSANARQLESLYNYQRVILNAFTEVVNRLSRVQNYSRSIAIKQEQVNALRAAVDTATKLFQNARVEYIEVLLANRDRLEATTVLIQTKREQLAAIVNTYQALGGGDALTLAKRKLAQSGCDPGGPGQPASLPEPDDVLPAPRREMLPAPEALPEPKPAGQPTTVNDQRPVSISLKMR